MAYPVGILVRRLTVKALQRIPGTPDALVQDGGRLARWLVYLIAAWALSLIGVSVGWVVVVVGVVLLLGFLMAKPMVENLAAGLLLTMRPAFGVGDQIDAAGYRGTVVEIGSRSTVLRATDGLRVHIPNTQVLSQPIVVYTASDSRKASFDVSVAADTDLDAATQHLVAAGTGRVPLPAEGVPPSSRAFRPSPRWFAVSIEATRYSSPSGLIAVCSAPGP